tara:strand:+ start:889 stop:1929 length:1041 start_codon:yes stop_codon:yes gene_type:complete
MAVNVNTVYKTTLLILNKEQRGYITPDEFNKISIQVQREILEQYFEELNQQLRVPQNTDEYANRIDNLQEKIDVFKKFDTCTGSNPFDLPTDVHRLGMLAYREKEIQEINRRDYFLVNKSPLTTPTTSNPLYVLEGHTTPSAAPSKAYVYPNTITTGADITAYYVKTPLDPRWGYYTGSLGQYVYDSTVYGDSLLNTGNGTLSSSITTNQTDFTNNTYVGTVGVTAGYSTSGAGTGLALSIVVSGNTVTSITITSAGTGFLVGDTITVTGAGGVLGGGTGNLVVTLVAADFNNNSTYGSTDFELHPSEQPNIVMNILMYCGVVIRDPQIVQNAAQMIAQEEALEKS